MTIKTATTNELNGALAFFKLTVENSAAQHEVEFAKTKINLIERELSRRISESKNA